MPIQSVPDVSIVIPARNEAETLGPLLDALRHRQPGVELIVVDDGSTDETAHVAGAGGARVIKHPYTMGNGAAIKTGARHACGRVLVFMDADGQHDPADIPRLLQGVEAGYAMVVGARETGTQASWGRGLANRFYNRLAGYMTGQRIADLTSGFRAARADRFREFLYLLPNGFSYPTTVTMAFFRAGYAVGYVPIHAGRRVGRSHIRPWQDGVRFLIIIFRIGTLYSPLKLFVPVALLHAGLGLGYYLFTFLTQGRLSVATVFFLTAAVTIFLIGLVSEQVTLLMYRLSGEAALLSESDGDPRPTL